MKKEGENAGASALKTSSMDKNSAGTAGVSLGIIAVLLSLISPVLGIALGIAALIFGLVQRRTFAFRWSTASILLGIISIIFSLLGIIISTIYPELLGGYA